MVNEDKVILMSKLAIYESRQGKRQLPLSAYYKRDYMKFNMLKTIIVYTIGYGMIAAAVVLVNLQYVLEHLNSFDYRDIAIKAASVYFVCLILYVLISRLVAAHRFESAKYDLLHYQQWLDELAALYEEDTDDSIRAAKKKGGSARHDEFTDY